MWYALGWLVAAVVLGCLADNRGRNWFGWMLLAMLISAPLAALVLLLVKDQSGGQTARCPACAELVRPEAKVCKHCGRTLPNGWASPPPAAAPIEAWRWVTFAVVILGAAGLYATVARGIGAHESEDFNPSQRLAADESTSNGDDIVKVAEAVRASGTIVVKGAMIPARFARDSSQMMFLIGELMRSGAECETIEFISRAAAEPPIRYGIGCDHYTHLYNVDFVDGRWVVSASPQ